MKVFQGLFLLSVLLLTGCDTVNWQQYRVANVPVGSPDATRLKLILEAVANKVGLEDQTAKSKIPGALAFYAEPNVEYFRVDISARFNEGDILIDVMAGFGPTPENYKKTKSLLESTLSENFNSRLSKPNPFVPIK